MTFETILNYIYEYVFLAPINTLVEYFGVKSQYIVYAFSLILIVAWALIILISKAFSYTARISGSCDKVASYLNKLDKKSKKKNSTVSNQITLEDEAGFNKFTKKCFGKGCNKNLKARWDFYLANQKGLPSECITSDQCLNRKSVGRGINRGRVLAFRYGAFLVSLLALMYCIKYAMVVEPEVPIMPGFITLLCLTLLLDLIINWVFTLADNGAVNNFYRMVNALDNQAAIYKDAVAYQPYYQDDQAYQDGAYYDEQYQDQAYQEGEYTEQYQDEQYADNQEYYDTTNDQYYDNSNEVYNAPVEEPAYQDFSNQQYEELPKAEATPVAPVEEVVAPTPVASAPADNQPSASQVKMQKIDALIEKAIKSKANKQTYMGLAKMLITASKTVSNEEEKAQLKACASKLLAQIK